MAKMKHINYQALEAKALEEKGCSGVKIRWRITSEEDAKNFAMRLFEVRADGYTPWHQHDWEHEIFILNGKGKAKIPIKSEPTIRKEESI